MRLEVGPVAKASAVAWMKWAHSIAGERGRARASGARPSPGALLDAVHYLERRMPRTDTIDKTIRWEAEVDPDALEYIVHAFVNLDAQLLAQARTPRGERASAPPPEGRTYYLVLVAALLHALETESACRAAFVDQLRWSWPSAAAAS